MDDHQVIEQKKPITFSGNIDLKEEEGKPDKKCEWIQERAPNRGIQCPKIVFKEGDIYCPVHKVLAKKKTEKGKVTFPELPPELPSEDEMDFPQIDMPVDIVPLPQSNIPDFLKNDQDIIDILRGLVMIRVKLAGLTTK